MLDAHTLSFDVSVCDSIATVVFAILRFFVVGAMRDEDDVIRSRALLSMRGCYSIHCTASVDDELIVNWNDWAPRMEHIRWTLDKVSAAPSRTFHERVMGHFGTSVPELDLSEPLPRLL